MDKSFDLIGELERFSPPFDPPRRPPMPKTTYRVTLPNGSVVKHKSKYECRFAVLTKSRPGSYWAEKGVPWGVYGWSTTMKRVHKMAREAERTGAYEKVWVALTQVKEENRP